MERLRERMTVANKALTAFSVVMAIEHPSAIERDAAIQRFEFTFETTWKAAKQMLFDIDGIDVASPKGVIRSCREVGLFDDEETIQALRMVDDRNLTVHTYDEALAMEIYERLKHHLGLLRAWLERIETRSRLNG